MYLKYLPAIGYLPEEMIIVINTLLQLMLSQTYNIELERIAAKLRAGINDALSQIRWTKGPNS